MNEIQLIAAEKAYTEDRCIELTTRIAQLEAKLARAREALAEIAHDPGYDDDAHSELCDYVNDDDECDCQGWFHPFQRLRNKSRAAIKELTDEAAR